MGLYFCRRYPLGVYELIANLCQKTDKLSLVILSMQSEVTILFPCHSERKRRISRKRKRKSKLRLTAGCFGKLNMTDLVGYTHFRMIPFFLVILSIQSGATCLQGLRSACIHVATPLKKAKP